MDLSINTNDNLKENNNNQIKSMDMNIKNEKLTIVPDASTIVQEIMNDLTTPKNTSNNKKKNRILETKLILDDDDSSNSDENEDNNVTISQNNQKYNNNHKKKNPINDDYICNICEKNDNRESLLLCDGNCYSFFHLECLHLKKLPNEQKWFCNDCTTNNHPCFICGKRGNLVDSKNQNVDKLLLDMDNKIDEKSSWNGVAKCTIDSCGKHYHQKCLKKHALTRFINDKQFICPLHTCFNCNEPGNGNIDIKNNNNNYKSIRCVRCPKAFHKKCLPEEDIIRINSRSILCGCHLSSEITISDTFASAQHACDSDKKITKQVCDNYSSLDDKTIKSEDTTAVSSVSLDDTKNLYDLECQQSSHPKQAFETVQNEGTKSKITSKNDEITESCEDDSSIQLMYHLSKKLKKEKKKELKKLKKLRKIQKKELLMLSVPSPPDECTKDIKNDDMSHSKTFTPDSPKLSPPTVSSNKVSPENKEKLNINNENSSNDEEENKWVQCDSCSKWRTVQSTLDLDSLPEKWFCHLNSWDKRFSSCSAPEEIKTDSNLKNMRHNKRNAKKNKKSSNYNEALSASQSSILMSDKGMAITSPLSSLGSVISNNKRKMKYKEFKWVQCEHYKCKKWRFVSEDVDFNSLPNKWYCHLNTWDKSLSSCDVPNPAGIQLILGNKHGNHSNGNHSKKLKYNVSSNGPIVQDTIVTTDDRLSNLSGDNNSNIIHRGRKSRPAIPIENCFSNNGNNKIKNPLDKNDYQNDIFIKKTIWEWVECEKCEKWRRLPQSIPFSTLPERWICSMNNWNPDTANCSAPEEEDKEIYTDPTKNNINKTLRTASSNSCNTYNSYKKKKGKLSFRELIFNSTGHIKKTYTSESSSLLFEYNNILYERDDQYKDSCFYQHPTSELNKKNENININSIEYNLNKNSIISNEKEYYKLEKRILTILVPIHGKNLMEIGLALHSNQKENSENNNNYHNNNENNNDLLLSITDSKLSFSKIEHVLTKMIEKGLIERYMPPTFKINNLKSIKYDKLFSNVVLYRKMPKKPLKTSKPWKNGTFNPGNSTNTKDEEKMKINVGIEVRLDFNMKENNISTSNNTIESTVLSN